MGEGKECGTHLVLPLTLGALEPQHQLLGGLRLLPQDGLGLTTESLLLAIVPALPPLIIRHFKFTEIDNKYIRESEG